MRTLNLGILAHVDAGKTTLTERLLYTAGAISKIGSVDAGTTQTDSLALERERGITIKSAVASFAIDDLTVNILDTPGHPDFIAEVERVLRVLDGAILVISAVEGVQPQTPLLYRALARLNVPTLFFLNKLDRRGADPDRVLAQIADRLTPAVVPVRRAIDPGTPDVAILPLDEADEATTAVAIERLSEHDESLLATYVERGAVPWPRLQRAIAAQSRAAQVHPVFMGSAIGGQGVRDILDAVPQLLPQAQDDPDAPVRGRVFKIERSASGERVAYVRLFDGTISARDHLPFGDGEEGRVTHLAVTQPGGAAQAPAAAAGQIAKIAGLAGVRVGDPIGVARLTDEERQFPPPGLESVVRPRRGADAGRLRAALNELADQDPLIDVRQDDERGEIAVSLYGEVQKEVIGETLAREYGVEVDFAATTTICIERPVGTAEVLEVISSPSHSNISGKSSPTSENPYNATIGLRIEPGKPGSGVSFGLDVDVKLVPLQIFNTVPQFEAQMARMVADALEEGVHGWRVTDCVVTMFDSGYRRTGSTMSDFKKLTALVLGRALRDAGVVVCEPMSSLRIDAPVESGKGITGVILNAGGRILGQHSSASRTTIVAFVQAGRVHEVQNRIPGLTGGEGIVETQFAGFHPVTVDPPPTRRRRT
ncbi:MAG TPA: translation factor GTPase family protein [Candidatus Limnocylindrales bacterium]|nr:translation factor GTPase family protein [Candidatus Limnocylindrales bacterium]